jgi:hypothetical protein
VLIYVKEDMQVQVEITSEQLLAGRKWDEQAAVEMHVHQSDCDPGDSGNCPAMPTRILDTMHFYDASLSEQPEAGQDQDKEETIQIQSRQSDLIADANKRLSELSAETLDTLSYQDGATRDELMAADDHDEPAKSPVLAWHSSSGSEGSKSPSASPTATLDMTSSQEILMNEQAMCDQDQGEQMASRRQRSDPIAAASEQPPREGAATPNPPSKAATGHAILRKIKRKHCSSRRRDAPP